LLHQFLIIFAFSAPASIKIRLGISGSKIQLILSSTIVAVLLPILFTLNSDIAADESIKSK